MLRCANAGSQTGQLYGSDLVIGIRAAFIFKVPFHGSHAHVPLGAKGEGFPENMTTPIRSDAFSEDYPIHCLGSA